jgi:hypothetical protein
MRWRLCACLSSFLLVALHQSLAFLQPSGSFARSAELRSQHVFTRTPLQRAARWHPVKPESSKVPHLLSSLKPSNEKIKAQKKVGAASPMVRVFVFELLLIPLALVLRKLLSLKAPIVWSRRAFVLGFSAVAVPLLLLVAVTLLEALVKQ